MHVHSDLIIIIRTYFYICAFYDHRKLLESISYKCILWLMTIVGIHFHIYTLYSCSHLTFFLLSICIHLIPSCILRVRWKKLSLMGLVVSTNTMARDSMVSSSLIPQVLDGDNSGSLDVCSYYCSRSQN